MTLDGLLSTLLENSGKILLFLVALAGLLTWVVMSGGDPLKAVQARCDELRLPVRVVRLEQGSDEEGKFLLMVPARQRTLGPDGQWLFCRANLTIRLR